MLTIPLSRFKREMRKHLRNIDNISPVFVTRNNVTIFVLTSVGQYNRPVEIKQELEE